MSGLLKNEDYQLPSMLKIKIAFSKLLKTEDLKTPLIKCEEYEDHVVCREPHNCMGGVDKTSCLTNP